MRVPSGRNLYDAVPLVVGVWLVWSLIGVWSGRLFYPYDLEWMEGGMLAHSWRIQQGLPIYVEPGPDWIPFIYPPGYATALAWTGEVFGLSHATGRALSLFGSVAAAFAIVYGVGRQTRAWTVGLVCGFCFLGCYPHTGAFYDLVRLDGLYVGLLAWSVVLALERWRGALELSAVLLFTAFLFKQNVALFGLPIALALWKRDDFKTSLLYFAWSGGPALAFTAYMHVRTGGVYLKYLLAVPGSHPVVGGRVYPGTPRELGWALVVVTVICAVWLLHKVHKELDLKGENLGVGMAMLATVAAFLDLAIPRVTGIPYMSHWVSTPATAAIWVGVASTALLLTAGLHRLDWRWVFGLGVGTVAVVTTALMRGHHGGFLNVHIQLFWVMCFAGGIAVGRMRVAWPSEPVAAATAGLLALQLAIQSTALEPDKLLPSAEDVAAGNDVVESLEAFDGPILSAYHPWLVQQAGGEPGFHLISLWDVIHPRSPFQGVRGGLRKDAAAHHWDAVVTGSKPYGFGIKGKYRVDTTYSHPPGVLRTKTGWRASPRAIMVPREARGER